MSARLPRSLPLGRALTISALVLECLWVAPAHGDALTRVKNSTLRFPPDAPRRGYMTAEAFPGLSFANPVCIVSAPGETNRIFILERAGDIQAITNLSSLDKTLFLGLTNVDTSGEGGLLGLAFHPGYSTNGFFYLYYTLTTTSPGGTGFHNRLSRFQVSPDDPNRGRPDSELVLINQFDLADNHNGGALQFGPDGYLYLSLGDGGLGNDELENSQRIDKDFFSAILRIDVDFRPENLTPNPHPAASTNYRIPHDNPFIGATNFNGASVDPAQVRTEFYAVGFRNPWRMSFDGVTGELYCADVGEQQREEIDIVVRGGNYGWNYREGTTGTFREPVPVEAAFIDPILDYKRIGTSGDSTREGNSIIGGFVYRGHRLSQLTGSYIFGDHISGNVWALRWTGTNVLDFRLLTTVSFLSTFGIDPSTGDVLIAELWGTGTIYRLIYSETSSGQPLPETLADTGTFSDVETLAPNPGIFGYDVNVSFWSDTALKSRWFSIPDTNLLINFDGNANWWFPTGTVWIKHFELELTNGVPASRRRLETRFLVRDTAEGLYGVTYRWGDSLTNAAVVPEEGLDESFVIYDGSNIRTQVWHYPGRGECLICHTRQGGLALGFNTAQLNRPFDYHGTTENQLLALSRAGYFDVTPDPQSLPVMAHATNTSFSVEYRVRSYLAANCVQCHQPGGPGRGYWDARFSTPLDQAGITNGNLVNNFGNPLNKVVRPGSIEHSVLFQRIAQLGPAHMPPLATSELNQEAMALLREWITNELAFGTAPVAVDDQILRYLPGGAKSWIAALLSNDFDADNDPVSLFDVSSYSLNGGSLTRDDDWIYYTPPPGFTEDDSFTYTITDGHGRFATGTVNVLFNPEPPASNLSIVSLGDGSYRIRLNGMPRVAYRIEYTDRLDTPAWQLLGIRTANDFGEFEIVDTPVAGSGQRFYHAIYP
jgi:glucose/arabinose dehydrogenase